MHVGLASSMAPGHLALHVVLVRHGDLAGVQHTSCRLLRSIMHVCVYACMHICMYVCMCMLCVLDTCELISNDSVDYGLADYGLHGFENLSGTKHFFCLSILRSVYILDT